MDETREQQKIYSFFQGLVYFLLLLEFVVYCGLPDLGFFQSVLDTIRSLGVYSNIFFSKLMILGILLIVAIGSRPQK